MIGTVLTSSHSSCKVRLNPKMVPRVGDWLGIGNATGIVERIYYDSESNPCAHLNIYNSDDAWAPPVLPGSAVRLIDSLKIKTGKNSVCGGYFMSGEEVFGLPLDLDYLLGHSGQGVHAGAISGVGKTSYLMWLIRNIMESTRNQGPTTAAFVVNLKFSDLLNLHQPSSLTEEDLEIYRKLEIEPKPFENINYFSSCGSKNLAREDIRPFGYTIDNGLHLLQRIVWELDDKSKTLEALIEAIKNGKEETPEEFGHYLHWKSLWTEPPLCEYSMRPNSWGPFQLTTVRRFLRQAKMIVENQNSGLFIPSAESGVETIESIVSGISHGETRVLDFSGLSTTEKYVCMHELVSSIFKEATKTRRTIPQRIILYVDELNAYAPRTGAHPLKKLLLEISERGRSLGLSLISAAQFSSHVHPRVIGNASTKIIGRLSADEMNSPEYRYLSKDQRSWLGRMPKGEMIVDHAPIGKSVKVSFPLPPFHIGE